MDFFDTKQYRQDFLEAYTSNMILKCPEQDVLNSLFNKTVNLLPFQYNYQVQISYDNQFVQSFNAIENSDFENIRKSPKFVHFFGAIKPWHLPDAEIEYYDLFWKYAEKTPFYQELKEEAAKNVEQLAVMQNSKKSIRFSYIKEKILAGLASGEAKERHERERQKLKNQMVKIKAMSGIKKRDSSK